jgi:hypothetical protein
LANRLDGLPGPLQSQCLRIGGREPLRQGLRGIQGCSYVEPLESLLQCLASRIGAAHQRLCLPDGRELSRIQRQLFDRVYRCERQKRHIEPLAPLLHSVQDLRSKTAPFDRPRGCLPVGAEPHASEAEVFDDQLLLCERRRIQLEPDLVGLDQVACQSKGVGDLKGLQVHRRLAGKQVQLTDVDLGAEQLGACLFRGIVCDGLREHDHQERQNGQQQ